MTTNTSINISKQNVIANCDLKCAYNFVYPETSLTANNEGQFIMFTLDKTNTPPVVYNQQKYSVDTMMIVSPSIHIFNDSTTNAELIISHTPLLGGNKLSVCIPISQSSDTSIASNLVTELIENVASNAPALNETTTINIDGFTLNSIVPNKPFYSYTDENDNIEYIVFDILDAISLNSDVITSLTQIIQPYPLPTPGGNLFYNKLGPNQSKIGSGYYMKCQPTGSSKEETEVVYSKNDVTYDLLNILNNPNTKPFVQIIIGCVIFILVMFLLNYIFSYISGEKNDIITTSTTSVRRIFKV
jgi:hypothetical protein